MKELQTKIHLFQKQTLQSNSNGIVLRAVEEYFLKRLIFLPYILSPAEHMWIGAEKNLSHTDFLQMLNMQVDVW